MPTKADEVRMRKAVWDQVVELLRTGPQRRTVVSAAVSFPQKVYLPEVLGKMVETGEVIEERVTAVKGRPRTLYRLAKRATRKDKVGV